MPTEATNLAETLKVLIYAYDYVTTDNRPKDIEPWYSYYIAEANKMGIDHVTESMAEDQVLRSEVMDYIVKIFYGQTVDDPVQFLVDEEITNGSSPDMPLNRSELVVLAYRAAEKTDTIADIEFGKVVTSTLGDKVADRAELEIGRKISTDGNNEWVGWADGKLMTFCARFVRVMFGKGRKNGYGSAKDMCDAYEAKGDMKTEKDGTPERGDAICYLPDSSNWDYGHIAIATGDGREIGVTSTSKGVTVRPILKTANYYQGFIKAEDYNAHY